jgi:hypothetical protein
MDCHVFLALVEVIIVIATFDLWMSREGFDTFALVVNYINSKWEPCHIMVGIFEVHETSIFAMVLQLKILLIHFDLCDKVITYVTEESAI